MTTNQDTNASRAKVAASLQDTRACTEALAEPLSAEDQTIQSMTDASPAKWHRAHTTWFFETFILSPNLDGYRLFDEQYGYIFNSYYEAIGARHPRPERGLLTRPTAEEIRKYRNHVDLAMHDFIMDSSVKTWREIQPLIILGINHEQQHQELLLMDILHAFSCNPLEPNYAGTTPLPAQAAPDLAWIEFNGEIREIGKDSSEDEDFYFDNEGPRHEVVIRPFKLANRLTTNLEWIEFIEDGGYERPEYWLADGWAKVQSESWRAPLYWYEDEPGQWSAFGLRGRQPVNLDAPVCHVSYFEANAFASWARKRLPTEAEWEIAAEDQSVDGNLLPRATYRTVPAMAPKQHLTQMYGDVWEHTQSPYAPYPGYKTAEGAVGEYNGKFMSNQMVLRGGSCITPAGHIRKTYRNFFYPHQRWMFAGVRLAEDA